MKSFKQAGLLRTELFLANSSVARAYAEFFKEGFHEPRYV